MSIIAKTTTGTEVTLTGIEHYGHASVRVEFIHPKLGKMSFESGSYGERKGHHGILGHVGSMPVCITVPRESFNAAMTEARQIRVQGISRIKAGEQKIKLRYHDGEYLSGYIVQTDYADELLIDLGVANHVSGWGVHVEPKLVAALGEEFTYAQAVEFARPELEKKQAAKEQRDVARAAKFAQAKETGKPVELDRWTDECCERDFECDLDIVTQYAMPDGSTRTERIHTH